MLKYARRTMCTRYKCQKAATAERVARIADGGGDDAVVPTYCFEIKEVIGMRFAYPERLVARCFGKRGERAGRGVVAPSDGLLPRAATVGRRPGGQKPGDDGALDGA